jgi:hypothetical protein
LTFYRALVFFQILYNLLFFIMASINKVYPKKVVDTIMKEERSIRKFAATETSNGKRPDAVAQAVGGVLAKSVVGYTGTLPKNTQEICSR